MIPERFSELCHREVIDICDGRRLGYVRDAVLDTHGCITALVVPGRRRLFGLLGREEDIIVRWCCIVRIGEDLILVRLREPRAESAGNCKPE